MKNKVTLDIIRNETLFNSIFGWTDISITRSLETLSSSFEIRMTQKSGKNNTIGSFSVQEGDDCAIKIDNKKIITGFIDELNVSYDSNSHNIQVIGRDKTEDLIDSSLIGNADFLAEYTPKQLVEHILSILGITSIKVIDNTGIVLKYKEDFNSDAGKNAWQQLDKYLQKKSIFATVDEDGNIVLMRGSFGSTNDSLYHLINDGSKNNIKSGSRNGSLVERYNKISVVSQSANEISDGLYYEQGGESYSSRDSSIRTTRQLEIIANANLTSEECQDLANFQRNIRQARGTSYSFTVQGFTQSNGDLWLPNYEVYIEDEFFGIKDSFLIKSVSFRQNNDTGTITILNVVDKRAYTLREPIAITTDGGILFQ